MVSENLLNVELIEINVTDDQSVQKAIKPALMAESPIRLLKLIPGNILQLLQLMYLVLPVLRRHLWIY